MLNLEPQLPKPSSNLLLRSLSPLLFFLLESEHFFYGRGLEVRGDVIVFIEILYILWLVRGGTDDGCFIL